MQNERKLAAILSADVAGYSRLMGDNEQATLATLTEYRNVMREQIAAHHGRVVNAPGDALLAEFPSAVEAVECAVEIQNTLALRNDALAEHRRMRVRIGINLGDVIEQDDALYGDGVNVAARLEAMCEPGGVCVSGTIFDQVEDKTSVGFQFGGQHHVKNITKPVRAYHAQLAHPGSPGIRLSTRKKRFLLGWSAFAILTCLGLWVLDAARGPTGTEQTALLELPSGPVVAVLPFTNMDGDPSQEYFSDGLTEDIITELSRFREIHVLARNTTFQYRGQSVDISALARELGAQYVLEGSVRRAGARVRITAQLIDGSNGVHLWAERFDRDYEDVFKIQDEVAHLIVGTVASGYGGGNTKRRTPQVEQEERGSNGSIRTDPEDTT
jgi:adenylate cyclase